MKFNEKFDINPDYADLLEFNSEKSELKHEATMLMFRFLSEIERINGKSIQNKDIATSLKTSRSFVTQLFNGDKLANLITIAKLQKAFNIVFEVKAVPNTTLQNQSNDIEYESPDVKTKESHLIPIRGGYFNQAERKINQC